MKVSEEYKRLYHYTTWNGLLGILKNQSLWATHHRFLNDYSETLLMKNKLFEFVRPVVHKESSDFLNKNPDHKKIMQQINDNGGFEALVDQRSSLFIDGMYESLPNSGLYITSFCKENEDEYINENGVLSQWRGYGRDGGFALVFNAQGLEHILQEEVEKYDYSFLQLSDVVYSDDEEGLKSELGPRLHYIKEHIKRIIRSIPKGKYDPDPEKDSKEYDAFISCISRYKHQGFKEENEVRICAFPVVHNEEYLKSSAHEKNQLPPEKERKFREKNGEWVPYIELFDSLDKDLPIEKIIVGPHQNMEMRVSALKVMLCGKNIDVRASDIPFIG